MFKAIQDAVGGAFDNVVEVVQGAFGGKREIEGDNGDEPPTKKSRRGIGWESKVQKAARKQLEFYFSDSNYRRSNSAPLIFLLMLHLIIPPPICHT